MAKDLLPGLMHPRKESVQQKKILYSLGKQKVVVRRTQPTIPCRLQEKTTTTKWHHQWNTAYHIHIPSWFDHGEDDDNGWPRRSIILLGKTMTKKTQCTAIIHDDGHHGLYNPKYCRPATTTATAITTMIIRWQLHTGGYSKCASGETEDLDSPESLHQFQIRRVVLDTTQQQQHHPSRKRVVVERRVARHIRGSNISHYSNLISPK